MHFLIYYLFKDNCPRRWTIGHGPFEASKISTSTKKIHQITNERSRIIIDLQKQKIKYE